MFKSIKNSQVTNETLSKNANEISELFRRQALLLHETKGFIYFQDENGKMTSVGNEVKGILGYEKEDFKSKYTAMIHSLLQEGFPLREKEQTIEYFYKIYKDYFNSDFSYDNFDSRTIQSKYNKTSLNKINQEANKYRDQHIIALVDNEFKKHNKIYLQIGGWHAIVCEPAFRKITEGN